MMAHPKHISTRREILLKRGVPGMFPRHLGLFWFVGGGPLKIGPTIFIAGKFRRLSDSNNAGDDVPKIRPRWTPESSEWKRLDSPSTSMVGPT